MPTLRLAIKSVNREHPIWIVKPADFSSEVVGEIAPMEVYTDPKYTLYCFDPENQTALFVESRDPLAVDRAAFYYQGQVEQACGLVSMPMSVFHGIANEIQMPSKGLIFVHSVGRCGSTLVSKVLQAIPTVHSLSEPDDLSQMVNLRVTGVLSDERLEEMLSSSIRWRCKPRIGPPVEYVAIKPRSEVMVLADLIGPAYRDAKHLFLYRDGLSWMGTLFRGFPLDRDIYDDELNRKMEESWSRTLPMITAMRREKPMNPVQVRILAWITCMEGYLRLQEMGLPIRAARFEDLTANPEPILRQICDFCGFEGVDWESIQEVLGRDSQAGTIYDREERKKLTRQLTPELIQDVKDAIGARPKLKSPGVGLPGTIGVDPSR